MKLAGKAYVGEDLKIRGWWHVESHDSDPADGGVVMVTFTGPWAREMAVEWANETFPIVIVEERHRPSAKLHVVK